MFILPILYMLTFLCSSFVVRRYVVRMEGVLNFLFSTCDYVCLLGTLVLTFFSTHVYRLWGQIQLTFFFFLFPCSWRSSSPPPWGLIHWQLRDMLVSLAYSQMCQMLLVFLFNLRDKDYRDFYLSSYYDGLEALPCDNQFREVL